MTILVSHLVRKRPRRRGKIEDRVGPLADASVEGLAVCILLMLMPFNRLGLSFDSRAGKHAPAIRYRTLT